MKTAMIAAALLPVAAKNVFAAMAAMSMSGGTLDYFGDDTTGFRFTVGPADIAVSALGFYDDGSNGLTDSHELGIYSLSSAIPLASATVPGGAGAVLENGFRYVDVTPFTLTAGTTYVIVAYRPSSADGVLFNAVSVTSAPWLTFITGVAANATGGLVFTNSVYANIRWAWFGPNFKAEVVADPCDDHTSDFRITGAVLENEHLLISFPGKAGCRYTLWQSETMAAGAWTDTGLPALTGTGGTLTFSVPAPTPGRRFFRVQAGP